jgi:hypothetical protein
MKSIYKIIREEYRKFLKEYDEDGYEYLEREDEVKQWIFSDFLYKNTPDFTKNIPWRLVSFPRLKKIWEDYIRTGVVRDTNGLQIIEDIMISNTFKISVLTELAGHTEWGSKDDFEENIGNWVDEQLNCILPQKPVDTSQLEIPFNDPSKGNVKKEPINTKPCNTQIHPFVQKFYDEKFDEEMDRNEFRTILYSKIMDKFFDHYMEDPKIGQAYISDYGLKPLVTLSYELSRTTESKEKITIIDKMLNVVHQRSDMAGWFVQGGSRALNQLSGYGDEEGESVISGKYNMADYR